MTADSTLRADVLEQRSVIDAQNPWPGLGSFDEAAQRFFNGRAKETAELRRLVSSAPLTVVFGASGLGKTSLLRAGLFPLLRRDDILPVYVRLDLQNRTAPLVDQLKTAMVAQFREQHVDAPTFGDNESLWEWLHREKLELWSRRNRLLTPLFVLDQFEEVFEAKDAEAVVRFRIAFADLVENRIPDGVNERVRANDTSVSALALSNYRHKTLLSFREDFLPQVEGWKKDMPSIMGNRLRLLPMSSEQAFQAVHDTAPHLTDEAIAAEIVRFVAAAQADGSAGARSDSAADENSWVEPALLSLVCSGLNEQRKAKGQRTLDVDRLSVKGRTIVSDYYRKTIADLSPKTRRFVEEELITERGFRKPCDIDDAKTVHGVPERELQTLVDRRLLRIEPRQRTYQIELTHDLLTGVVREHRDEQRNRAKLRSHWTRLGIAGAVLLVIVMVGAYVNAERKRANETAASANETTAVALGELRTELDEVRRNADENERLAEERRQQLEEALKKLAELAPAPGVPQSTRELYESVRELAVTAPAAANPDSARELARQLNDPSAQVRTAAGGQLARDHRADPVTVRIVLETLSEQNLPTLSATGRINALYFLARADSAAWTDENKLLARQAIVRIRGRAASGVAIGNQTKSELESLELKVAE